MPELSVRLLRDYARQDEESWFKAWLKWPKEKSPYFYDLALLQLEPKAVVSFAIQGGAPLRYVARDECNFQVVACQGFGFPEWQKEADRYAPLHSKGELELSMWEQRPNSFDYRDPDRAPRRKDDWKGFSGAALIDAADKILAVVGRTREVQLGGLFYTTLLPDDPEFRSLVEPAAPGGGAPAAPAPRPPAAPLIVHSSAQDYLHIINRRDQDETIERGFRQRGADDRPALVLFHSRDKDDPPGYPRRYGSDESELKLWAESTLIREISMPNQFDSVPDALGKFKAEIARYASETGLLPTSSNQDFQSHFARARLPPAWQICLQPQRLSELHYDLLDSFFAFFAAAAKSQRLNCLFVGLVYEPDPNKENDFIDLDVRSAPVSKLAASAWNSIIARAHKHTDNLHIWEAGALRQVGTLDVNPWRDQLERLRFVRSQSFFDRLRREIGKTTSVPLTKVSDIIKQLES